MPTWLTIVLAVTAGLVALGGWLWTLKKDRRLVRLELSHQASHATANQDYEVQVQVANAGSVALSVDYVRLGVIIDEHWWRKVSGVRSQSTTQPVALAAGATPHREIFKLDQSWIDERALLFSETRITGRRRQNRGGLEPLRLGVLAITQPGTLIPRRRITRRVVWWLTRKSF